jgi:poly-gamma-glutamate synthesis protein (capsule biosynthesis protein)
VPADKWVALRQKPAILGEYKRMNIGIVTLANNHMLDYGQSGLIDTLKNLDRFGIGHVGGGRNLREALTPVIVEDGGLRTAFLGFASTLPLESPAKEGRPGIAPIRVRSTHYFDPVGEMEQPGTPPVTFTYLEDDDVGLMRRVVRSAKRSADYVIVGVHWGMPFQETLLEYQIKLGHAFVDAGADLVIGNHPHRLQAVEAYKAGFIFHSLGNFLFSLPKGFVTPSTKWNFWPPRLGEWYQSEESAIVQAELNSRGEATIEMIPTVREGQGYPKIVGRASFRRILSHLSGVSETLNVAFRASGRTARVLAKK